MTHGVRIFECKSCGAQIYWAISDATGLLFPVDVEPDPDGNVLLSVLGTGQTKKVGPGEGILCRGPGTVIAHVIKKGEEVEQGRPRRRNHFATCPHARRWSTRYAGPPRGNKQ